MQVIIPTNEGSHQLIEMVTTIKQQIPDAVLTVVNDGGSQKSTGVFSKLEENGVTVLHHLRKKGRGAALKTAFAAIQPTVQPDETIVTIDMNRYYTMEQILSVVETSQESPNHIVLGSRHFVGKMPLTSRLGHKISSGLYRLSTGQQINDAMSGLRAFSPLHLDWLLSLNGQHADYEFNQLIEAEKAGYVIEEKVMTTVAIEKNTSDVLNSTLNYMSLFAPFIKFVLTSSGAAIIDFVLLMVLYHLTNQLLFSVVVARVISASFQCFMNANVVFNKTDHLTQSVIKYIGLVIVLLLANYAILRGFVFVGLGLAIAKILTEVVLFLTSYRVQKNYVFA